MEPLKTTTTPDAKLHFLDYWRIIRIRKTIILTVFVLVLITTVAVTFSLRPTYCGTAKIKVAKDQTDIAGMFEPQSAYSFDPYFLQTESGVISSQVILDNVISNLNLNVEWGNRYASGQMLKTAETRTLFEKLLDLRITRNSSFIEIRFFSESQDEAARVANEVANTYQNYRLELRYNQTFRGIKSLQKDYDAQLERIRQAQDELDRLRVELNINDVDAMVSGTSQSIENEIARRAAAQLTELRPVFAKEEAQLNDLKNMPPEKLRNALPRVTDDRLLVQLLMELDEAENKLVIAKNDYGLENPIVKGAARLVDNLTQKINDSVEGTLIGLQSRVNADKAAIDNLTGQVENARKTDTATTAKSRPYFEKKTKLEELQFIAKNLNIKIAAEMVQLNLPKTSVVEFTDHADASTLKPVRPRKTLNIALGVIFGLIVGVGLAFFIEYLDTSVKTIDDVERALQSPVLGVIPQNVGRLMDEGAESPHAEAYRVLRTNLLFSRKDEKLNSLAVVSAGAGEGKSTTVFNLATVFAQSGQRVVVVDSDLRRPSLHKLFRVTNNLGLTNYLLKQNTLDEVIQTTDVPTLNFLASGKLPSSSMGILSSSAMKSLITELKARYDFVFFDSPPIMGVSDASILASEVDMTLQVIQYRRYPQPMNVRAKQLIEKVGGNLMGIVLNNINMAQDESYYYYSGYYHEYYSQNEEEKGGKKPPTKDA